MDYTVFSATGCARCKLAKKLMDELGLTYEDKDMKAEGKEDFRKFYAANRRSIFRGPDGIEFPILYDGQTIKQSLPVVVGWLTAGSALDGYFYPGLLHGQWLDGITPSGGDPARADEFMEALKYLKKQSMKIQIDTSGPNASVLERILTEKLADRVIMEVKGPLSLYDRLLGRAVDPEDIRRSIALATQFPEYRFETVVSPVVRGDAESSPIEYMTPEEIGETARLIKEAAGGVKHPYLLKLFRPQDQSNDRLRAVEPLSASALFPYRTAARANLVTTEIEKA